MRFDKLGTWWGAVNVTPRAEPESVTTIVQERASTAPKSTVTQAYIYALDPTPDQAKMPRSHIGGSRFGLLYLWAEQRDEMAPWWSEIDSSTLNDATKRLGDSVQVLRRLPNIWLGSVSVNGMTWIAPEPPDDKPAPDTGDIRPILQGYLDHQRLTLLRICVGLNAEQLVLPPVPPSTLSLLGLVRHMTKVERTWLRIRAAGEDIAALFTITDEDFDDLDSASAPQAIADLAAEWARCDTAVKNLPLDHCVDVRGHAVSLASIYVHLIEEWARHNGHADIIRQALDGVTGR